MDLPLGRASEFDSGADPVASSANVRIVVVGTEAQLREVRTSVAEWRLGDRAVSWERARSFDPRSVLAPGANAAEVRCWVDLRHGSDVHLYFTNGVTQRYLVRTLEIRGRFDELDREALGQAIELSLLAMVEDREAGLSRSAAESLLAPPVPAPAPTRPVESAPTRPPPETPRFELGAGYAAGPWLDRAPFVHGPGLHLGYTLLSEPRLALVAAGQYRLGSTWTDGWVALEAQSTAWGLGVEVAPRLFALGATATERLAVRVGAGAEWVRIAPSTRGAEALATPGTARERLVPLLLAAVQSLTLLPGDVTLRLGVAAEILPEATRYEVELAGERSTLFRTPRIRPSATLSVGVLLP